MVKYICYILLFFIFSGCQSPPNSMEIYAQLNDACPSADCEIYLDSVIHGNWTQVIFAKRMCLMAELESYIDVDHLDLGEFDDAILFAQGREITRMEIRTYHPEKPFNQTVFLDFPEEKQRVVRFSRAEAHFKMRKSAGVGFKNIYLIPQF